VSNFFFLLGPLIYTISMSWDQISWRQA
jgi:hypothetical protein